MKVYRHTTNRPHIHGTRSHRPLTTEEIYANKAHERPSEFGVLSSKTYGSTPGYKGAHNAQDHYNDTLLAERLEESCADRSWEASKDAKKAHEQMVKLVGKATRDGVSQKDRAKYLHEAEEAEKIRDEKVAYAKKEEERSDKYARYGQGKVPVYETPIREKQPKDFLDYEGPGNRYSVNERRPDLNGCAGEPQRKSAEEQMWGKSEKKEHTANQGWYW